MSPLVSVDDLAAEIAADAPVRLLDVRWRLDRAEGRPEYLSGHLPGAVYVDLERELARPGRPEQGRHPVPDRADLEVAVRRWGVRAGDRLVAYDDNDGVAAARAWWLLRRHGLDVRVLDGGFRAWVASGRRLERSDRAAAPGDIELAEGVGGLADIDEAAVAPSRGIVLDVRAPQHYRGQIAGADPVSGHIPGAVNLPTVTHIAPTGLMRGAEEIRAALATVGIGRDTDVVVSCSSGIASAHTALAFTVAGYPRVRVFAGSWSQWSRDPGRPVATGPSPSAAISVV
ncbi:sulfurtransferase [Microbacterium sp. cf332]|uniref:sulfurtransferase n=1 Tax=Microbacterium sp. cf332 TaxID=1761804 RepID=UPI00088B204D|nr:sulfurtransferase [Microbacterium sp. cf332]SDQ28151.1 thiosulfate/3-mercaptopyruvate sulfurtransferase [Microbacterium sp. cf332]